MSLSRILNDHPVPASVPPPPVHQAFNNPPPPSNIISPRHERSPSPSFPHTSRQPHSSPAHERRTGDFASRSGAHKDTSAWDDVGEWRQPSRAHNGNAETPREASPSSVQEYQYSKNDEASMVHKKRKRTADDDGDYRPPSTRRVRGHPLIVDVLSIHHVSQAAFTPSTTAGQACPCPVTASRLSRARDYGASVARTYRGRTTISILGFERLRGYMVYRDRLLHARNAEAQEDDRGFL